MKTVAITKASGFIGRAVAGAMAAKWEFRVRSFDRSMCRSPLRTRAWTGTATGYPGS